MKRFVNGLAALLALLCVLPLQSRAEELLIPVGQVVGLELRDSTVVVAALDDSLGAAAREAGIQPGDEILRVNSTQIRSVEDVRTALDRCDGSVDLLILRGEKQRRVSMKPVKTEDGLRLGLYLRQGIAGLGTVTYYDPSTGAFGALGHGVSTSRGELLAMTEGSAFPGQVASVRKGKAGQPGQLQGSVTPEIPVGILKKNTARGVFGISRRGWTGQPLPVASYDEVTAGPAVIRSNVEGDQVREYSVEILKIYPENRPDSRNFLLKVTDPALLEKTGGIVQGMSGSPLVQDGKLIGAVTHVLVNDPTTGYGIFIENMLDAGE